MATLTTSPQIIGKNEGGTIHTYLYGWYDGQSGNNCTVHVRLTVINTGSTYTGTNKSYAIRIGNYDSGVQPWSYQPLNTGQEYTVAEATQGYSGGNQISASALFWSYVYNSADIGSLTDNWYVPTFSSPPTGLSVSVASVAPESATFNVSVSSYGTPSSASGRYLQAAILSANNYNTNPRRYQSASNTSSAQITVNNNSSTGSPAMTITPNTQYYYGMYANNTQEYASKVQGQFVTTAAAMTIDSTSITGRAATFSYSASADGGFYTKTLEYSIDGGITWETAATISGGSAASGTFNITGLDPCTSYTLKSRVVTTAGTTDNLDYVFITLADLYGSVNGIATLQLKGDTTQDRYTGKNLVDAVNATWFVNSDATMVLTDGVFKMTCGPGVLARCCLPLQNLVNGTTYTVSFYAKGVSIASSASYTYARVRTANNGGTWLGESTRIPVSNDFVRYSTTFTAGSASNPWVWFYLSGSTNNTGNVEIYVKDIQIEVGSTMTTYEDYVGGTPAPNPSYPETVNVVSGEQIITVTTDDPYSSSWSYTVDLTGDNDTIELCKIGEYQDYIYKSGSDWYVHKATGKATLGDLSWHTGSTNTTGVYRMVTSSLSGLFVHPDDNTSLAIGYCDYFVPQTAEGTYYKNTGFSQHRLGTEIHIYHPDYNTSISATDFTTWLQNNNVTLYYALTTPTDTQITDSTIISQLDDILDTTIYSDSVSITATGNLPAIVAFTLAGGATKRINKLYGSVNGQTKQIIKFYGSVNGETKRIF